jgi:hypothetical protein
VIANAARAIAGRDHVSLKDRLMNTQPPKTDPDDMSRPGPITFLILAGCLVVYLVVAYGADVLDYLGLR